MTQFESELFNMLKDELQRATFIKKQTRIFWVWLLLIVPWIGLVVADICFSKGRSEWAQLTSILWLVTCMTFIDRARWSLKFARVVEKMSSESKAT